MKEAAFPSEILGFAGKVLAFSKAEPGGGRVAATAYELFEKRQRLGLPGTPEEDWVKAEEIVTKKIVREVIRRSLA